MTHNSKDVKNDMEAKVELTKASIKVLKAIDDGSILDAMRSDNIRGYKLSECEKALNFLAFEGKIKVDIGKNPDTGEEKLRSISIIDTRFVAPLLKMDENDDDKVRAFIKACYAISDLGKGLGWRKDEEKFR